MQRVLDMLDVQINRHRIAMEKSNTPIEGDMLMIRIQALEWVQGTIQDLFLIM